MFDSLMNRLGMILALWLSGMLLTMVSIVTYEAYLFIMIRYFN